MLSAQRLESGRAQALPSSWQAVLDACDYVPVPYTQSMVAYQTTYFDLDDRSQVIMHDNKPVGVWPIGIRDKLWVTTNGVEVLPPLLVPGLPERVQKRIIADCLRQIDEWAQKTGAPSWNTMEVVRDNGLSLWHRRCMENGANPVVAHEMFVDLSLSAEDILHNARKSYRGLVHQGNKEFVVRLGTDVEPLHDLHVEVAGRVTRSDATWEAQQAAIERGEAFVVYACDKQLRLVGGALFHHSRQESAYAVGVYDRELHDKPLGHVVQFFAIQHLQELGVRWHYLGLRPYAASDKELQIAHFKEGWATHTFPRVTSIMIRR